MTTKILKEKIAEATKKYPEGLYFGMPEEEYHSIPFFSRSFAVDILCDLEQALYNLENPIEQTEAMLFGCKVHHLFLEPELFDKLYVTAPDSESYNEKGYKILNTNDDIKEFLKSVDEKKSGNRPELIERAKPYLEKEKALIWSEVRQEFLDDLKATSRIELTNSDLEKVDGLRRSFAKRSQCKEILSSGYPEVTIIWQDEETGVMCKCRLDYLRPEAVGEIKTFSLKYNKPLFEALVDELRFRKYNWQFAFYFDALDQIITKIKDKKAKVFGVDNQEWIDKLLNNTDRKYFFLFVKTQAPYQIKYMALERSEMLYGTFNAYYEVARNQLNLALAKFNTALTRNIWMEKEGITLEDAHVPSIAYQESII